MVIKVKDVPLVQLLATKINRIEDCCTIYTNLWYKYNKQIKFQGKFEKAFISTLTDVQTYQLFVLE